MSAIIQVYAVWLAHERYYHRVYTCQAFYPVVRNGLLPPFGSKRGETHLLAGEGVVGPNPDERTDTLVLYNSSTVLTIRACEILFEKDLRLCYRVAVEDKIIELKLPRK
jgi:hypothetical protein